ncbi:hypothetical protein PO909_002822 [Leuciscus waleckii]
MPFSATSPYDPSSTLGSQYGVKCWDLHIYMHVHTFVHTYRYASSPYGAVLLIAFLPQPHSARPAPNICPCLKFLDNCLSCLLMQLKTWIYGSCHVACRKGYKEFAMPLL